MKKKLVLISVAASLLLFPTISLFDTVEATELTSAKHTFLERFTIVPDVPDESIIGEETTVHFNIDWQSPADVNVFQAIIKVDGNAELVSIGSSASNLKMREDGSASYIEDELQDLTTFPVVVKVTGEGPVVVNATLVYSDAVGEEEYTTPIELNVVKDNRSVDDVKKDSIDEIDKLDQLSQEEKDAYIDRINKTESLDEITSIKNESIQKNRDEAIKQLDESKENAKTTIDSLSKLTDEQREDLLAEVELASSVSDVESILEKAGKMNGEKPSASTESSETIKDSEKKDNKSTNSKTLIGVASILVIAVIGGVSWYLVKKKR